ncbi:MAG: NADP-dependent malic enzyme [Streblomastix strix]|uniref:NADP-dependent malic enzyme n=1 Tax=Streblomastix strix TaxID=222440 RepID=A0A5J4W486_9EUKA|nr:MAG: NADP-dependent malic enzyme [Streblomastix strix]
MRIGNVRPGADLEIDQQNLDGLLKSPEVPKVIMRESLGISGLLPPRVLPPELQERRILQEFVSLTDSMAKFLLLSDLYDRSVHLYYFIVCRNFAKLAPYIYTRMQAPTASSSTSGTARSAVYNIPQSNAATATKSQPTGPYKTYPLQQSQMEAIFQAQEIQELMALALPIGKLALYCAAAGCDPRLTLPAQIDVGTRNKPPREHELYLGLNRDREIGESYYSFVEEVILSINKRWPKAQIQFEDFGFENAFELLSRWRNRLLSFNDDIQGTGAVALSAIICACRARASALEKKIKTTYSSANHI